jgi:hypothetical protein
MLVLEKLASVTADLLFIGTYIALSDLRFTQSARSRTIPRTGLAECGCIRGDDSMRGIQKSGAHEHAEGLPVPFIERTVRDRPSCTLAGK